MGKSLHYACNLCDATAVCSPGPDQGFLHKTIPMVCGNCKSLANVVIGPSIVDEGSADSECPLKCNHCGDSGSLHNWDGKSCPKCSEGILSPIAGLTMWD
jgi:Zn finger protein HypA/HybF involved in hydrogenase expression